MSGEAIFTVKTKIKQLNTPSTTAVYLTSFSELIIQIRSHNQLSLHLVNWCYRGITTHKMLHLQEGKCTLCMEIRVYRSFTTLISWTSMCLFTFHKSSMVKVYTYRWHAIVIQRVILKVTFSRKLFFQYYIP